ncbi:MAG: hypothetical protein OHK0015_35140 [Chloroflexi bacterium OHK40]
MSNQPVGSKPGIFSLFFREAGLFWEQAFKWAEERAAEDRQLDAEYDRRRLSDAQARQTEAEARLLEQIRLAKEAGLDVDAILRRVREELR